jgi:hypothetical protein
MDQEPWPSTLPMYPRGCRLDFSKELRRLRLPIDTRRWAHVRSSVGLTFQVDTRHMGNTHFENACIELLALPEEAAFQQNRYTDGMQGTKIAQLRASDDVRVSYGRREIPGPLEY